MNKRLLGKSHSAGLLLNSECAHSLELPNKNVGRPAVAGSIVGASAMSGPKPHLSKKGCMSGEPKELNLS